MKCPLGNKYESLKAYLMLEQELYGFVLKILWLPLRPGTNNNYLK